MSAGSQKEASVRGGDSLQRKEIGSEKSIAKGFKRLRLVEGGGMLPRKQSLEGGKKTGPHASEKKEPTTTGGKGNLDSAGSEKRGGSCHPQEGGLVLI